MDIRALILPGIGNSGPNHWQTLWEQSNNDFQRVQQSDWDNPVCTEWEAALEEAVKLTSAKVVLVAHSLACLLVAHWAVKTRCEIKGALLVAVPDLKGPEFPKEAIGFGSVPLKRFPFPSIVVASTNDPYGSIEFAQQCSAAWQSRFVNIGAAGHINAASGLGSWPQGFSLLETLLA